MKKRQFGYFMTRVVEMFRSLTFLFPHLNFQNYQRILGLSYGLHTPNAA